MPLLTDLGDAGYTRYGVSANGFASAKYGFDHGFDAFYNTQGVTVYPDGLDVHGYAGTVREEGNDELQANDIGYLRLLRTVVKHERPVKSAINVAAAGLSQLVGQYSIFSRIPHRRFSRYNEFMYDPKKNTKWLTRLFEKTEDENEPFFLFTNYMDPHHPYAPPERFQQEFSGRTFRYKELDQIAEDTHPFEFIDRYGPRISPPEETLDTVRTLYTGEVRTADEHLGRLLKSLERHNLRDETVIVVTADHGENLGEVNEMGERRMGHVCSASDAHLRVPLVIAHPELEGRRVETPVSTKDLKRLFTDAINQLLETDGRNIGPLKPSDGIVASEVPATGTDILEQRYPDLQELLRRHLSVVYTQEWKVVLGSNESEWAWREGEEQPIEEAPDRLVNRCYEHLDRLEQIDRTEQELSKADVSHLEALGYI